MLGPLIRGGSVVIPESEEGFDLEEFVALCEKHEVTISGVVPSVFNLLGEVIEDYPDYRTKLISLRTLLVGGEALNLSRIIGFQNLFPDLRLFSTYGPSECSIISLVYPCKNLDASYQQVPLGKPLSNSEVLLLNRRQEMVPVGIAGELYLGGACVGQGYFKNPRASAKAFIDIDGRRWFKTGDLAYWDDDEQLHFVGRVDHQVKVRGQKVEPDYINSQLSRFDDVSQSHILVNEKGRLQAFVVHERKLTDAHEKSKAFKDKLKARLAEQLPVYMQPSSIILLSHMPLTAQGKVDHKFLEAEHLNLQSGQISGPDLGDLLQTVLEVWNKYLDAGQENDLLNRDSNFFELGGHSLLATRILFELEQRFSVRLNLRAFFADATPENLSQQIKANEASIIKRREVFHQRQDAEVYPLSFAQQRVFLASQVNPDSQAYNMPAVIRLTGLLDEQRFLRAFEEVLDRHAVFKTVFVGQGEAIGQRLDTRDDFSIESFDLSGESNPQKQLESLKRDIFDLRFDLLKEKPFRFQLVKLTQETWYLLVNVHHILWDGWSLRVLLSELGHAYRGDVLPQAAEYQYLDFALEQRSLEQNNFQALEESFEFWQRRLEGAAPYINLPLDYERPAVQGFEGGHVSIAITKAQLQNIRSLAQQERTTPFYVLLGAFFILLHRYSRQDDISLAIPSSGRTREETQSLIGFFVNFAVLRSDFSANQRFTDLLDQLQGQYLDSLGHMDVPLEPLMEYLELPVSRAYLPFAQVAFSHNRIEENLKEGFGDVDLRVEENLTSRVFNGGAKNDLTLLVREGQDQAELLFEFNRELFSRETVESFAQHYLSILQQVIENSEQAIAQVTLMSENDLRRLFGTDSYDGVMPLSHSQRDIYLGSLLAPDSAQHSEGFSFHIRQKLDLELWREAIQYLADQHYIIRGRLLLNPHSYDEIAYQGFDSNYKVNLQYLDWRNKYADRASDELFVDELQEALFEDCKELVYRHYGDLRGDLAHFFMIHLGEDHYYFVMANHHIGADGISVIFCPVVMCGV